MHKKLILIITLLASLLSGCNLVSPKTEPTSIPTSTPTLEFVQSTPIQPVSPTYPISVYTVTPAPPQSMEQEVLNQAAGVVSALKDKDMITLLSYIHPQKGLRFSPYAAVKDTDQVFQADNVATLPDDTTVYNWGYYASTGESMELTFSDYYSRFVYDVDFANAPQIAINHRLGVSTTMDNAEKFYPEAMIVEYYFPGFDDQLEGMDWRSLRLVFQQDNNTWYLVGIIHDQWTT